MRRSAGGLARLRRGLDPADSGARVVGPERGQRVQASDLRLDLRGLEPRLGPFVPQLREEQSWQRRVGLAQASLRGATSWSGCIAS